MEGFSNSTLIQNLDMDFIIKPQKEKIHISHQCH